MIRINLLKNRGDNTRVTSATEVKYDNVYDDMGGGDAGSSSSSTAIKLIFLVGGVVLLIAYESYNISQIKDQIAIVTLKRNKLDQEIREKKPIADKAKVFQKRITELEDRIKAIKDLSKFRLREIKAMDYIQNSIPEKVWLTNVTFENDTIKIEGAAVTDDEMNRFTELLETKSYFQDVLLLKATEEKKREGTIKNFQISSGLTGAD